MKTYFIVTQADTGSDGILQHSAIFCDNDGNTELYISAEEAREAIAREVEKYAVMLRSISFNDSDEIINVDDVFHETGLIQELITGLIQEVIKGIKAEDAQDVWCLFEDGSQRTYTIKAVTV